VLAGASVAALVRALGIPKAGLGELPMGGSIKASITSQQLQAFQSWKAVLQAAMLIAY